jgi:hypothetical protein
MFCPRCKAEYRKGFTRCADCEVDLVVELPRNDIEMRRTGQGGEYHPAGGPGDPDEDPFCSFWKGNDPRVHAELCSVLDESGIPHNTVFRRDHLFNLQSYAAFEVGVPFSMYERAGIVIQEAYGVEDVTDVGATEVQLLPDRPFPSFRRLPQPLTPGEAENIPGPPDTGEETGWYPEDATVKVWSTDTAEPGDFLIASLHENGIRCRLDRNASHAELYVLPQDEMHAKEIVREIVEAKPPE